MDKVTLIIIFLWISQALQQTLNWLYWVQVKEYRADRFWLFFISSEGKKRLSLYVVFLKILILSFSLLINALFFLLLVLLLLNLKFLKTLLAREFRRPRFTLRSSIIFSITFLGVLSFSTFIFLYNKIIETLLLGEVALVLLPFIGVFSTTPIVMLTKSLEIRKAKRRLLEIRPRVIGITGSYGKTTTKDFLAHLLSQRYKTAKTTGSENTELGIARKTAKHVAQGTQVYVVEMGAYKQGEIRKLAKIVNPEIAVITGIEPQHLALFGSLQNIKKAKYELVESLPPGAPVIFNLSNPYCLEMSNWAKDAGYKVYGYSLSGKGDLTARIVSASIASITFEIAEGKTKKRFSVSLPGIHFVENLVGAILVARLLGLSWDDVKKAVSSIKTPEKTMSVVKKGENAIIDDSFNATPEGFEAAIEYLSLFPNKKVVITQGIIELGKESEEVHRKLGRKLRKIDKVFLTSAEFLRFVQEGLGTQTSLVLTENPEALKKELEKIPGEKAILVEGRVPQSFWDVL